MAQVETVGKTGNGQLVYGLRVSPDVARPQHDHQLHVLLVGALRGDEPLGCELLLRFARHLVTGDTRSARLLHAFLKMNLIIWCF